LVVRLPPTLTATPWRQFAGIQVSSNQPELAPMPTPRGHRTRRTPESDWHDVDELTEIALGNSPAIRTARNQAASAEA
jgi:hypothetical protein